MCVMSDGEKKPSFALLITVIRPEALMDDYNSWIKICPGT